MRFVLACDCAAIIIADGNFDVGYGLGAYDSIELSRRDSRRGNDGQVKFSFDTKCVYRCLPVRFARLEERRRKGGLMR